MYDLRALPVRVLPGFLAEGAAPPPPRRGDYAALVRPARRLPPPAPPKDAADDSDRRTWKHGACHADHDDRGNEQNRPVHQVAALRAHSEPLPRAGQARAGNQRHDDLEIRLAALTIPCVGALAQVRHEFDGWVDFLVERAADFCCDHAICSNGQWSIRLVLDPAILPDCVLHLNLSYFTLTLRFETQAPVSRQLVMQHEASLRARLTAMLVDRGEHREIEIAAD